MKSIKPILVAVIVTITSTGIAYASALTNLTEAIRANWSQVPGWTGTWSFAQAGAEYTYVPLPQGQVRPQYDGSVDTMIQFCKNTSIHKERGWNHGTTLTAQQNVPLLLNSAEPSWTSRQVFDYVWSWWFGDNYLVVRSATDISTVKHTYRKLGTYKVFNHIWDNDYGFFFGVEYDGGWKPDGGPLTGPMKPHSCNYLTVNVVPNNAPVVAAHADAQVKFGGDAFIFTANGVDPDGNDLTYSWLFSNGNTATGRVVQQTWGNLTLEDRYEWAKVTVTDSDKSATTIVNVTVRPRTEECGPRGCN